MLGMYLSNSNLLRFCIAIGVFGLVLAFGSTYLFSNAIADANKTYDKALKFSTENAEEFSYAIKTQQGNLYATGELQAIGDTVSSEYLDGEYLAISETKEVYTHHTEEYECGYTDSDGDYHSETCTRSYWTWDYAGSNEWHVGGVSLLGVDVSSVPWRRNYVNTSLKDGSRYRRDGDTRWHYEVIPNNRIDSFGFTSDDNGFRYNPDIRPVNVFWLHFAKWTAFVLITGAGIFIAFFVFQDNYDEGRDEML